MFAYVRWATWLCGPVLPKNTGCPAGCPSGVWRTVFSDSPPQSRLPSKHKVSNTIIHHHFERHISKLMVSIPFIPIFTHYIHAVRMTLCIKFDKERIRGRGRKPWKGRTPPLWTIFRAWPVMLGHDVSHFLSFAHYVWLVTNISQ